MEIYCTRPGCPRPQNVFTDLDDNTKLKTTAQKYCTTCGMPLILDNRYFATKLLGKGGFGAAFLGRDRRTPGLRYCVIKQFLPASSLTPDQLQIAQTLFEREATVLDELGNRHPQIPDLFAFFPLDVPNPTPGQSQQFFYIVQEFVDGQDMEAELAERGAFSEPETLEILTEMLKVLQFVHDNGSIHRDIKPSNIMRRRDGRLYLLDFGAVKQATAGAAAGQPGKASTGIYSMGFAPPEQMRGDKVYPATDLYALAVTCITLLTGRQPNELHDPYSDTWNWRAYTQVQDRLEAVLNRMLLPIPSQRFQSANEVLLALQPVTQPQMPPAGAATSPQSTSPQPTRLPTPSPQPPPTRLPTPSPAPSPAPSPTAVQPPGPTQPTPAPVPAAPQPIVQPPRPFTLWEVLSSAAFTGFEGGLVAIALASLLGTAGLSPLFWLLLLAAMAGMVYAQSRRWVEKIDLLIIAGVTLLLVWLVPFSWLHQVILLPPFQSIAQALGLDGSTILIILFIAAFSSLLALGAATVFRLIYNLLSRLM